jgi:hypothetical protein
VKAYESAVRHRHNNLKVAASGLRVSGSDQYIRASPDGLVSCACHPKQWLLEIKCPWTSRDIDPVDAVKSGVIKYVTNVNDTFSLRPGATCGYFEQVQGTLAVTGLEHCDFVIWTTRGMLIIPVKFDQIFWETAKRNLQLFFENYVIAEILTERVRRSLPLIEDETNLSANGNSDELSTSDIDDDTLLSAVNSYNEPDFDSHTLNFYNIIDMQCDEEIPTNGEISSLQSILSDRALTGTDITTYSSSSGECDMQSVFFDNDDFELEETVHAV